MESYVGKCLVVRSCLVYRSTEDFMMVSSAARGDAAFERRTLMEHGKRAGAGDVPLRRLVTDA
jgi:hypothetical protein